MDAREQFIDDLLPAWERFNDTQAGKQTSRVSFGQFILAAPAANQLDSDSLVNTLLREENAELKRQCGELQTAFTTAVRDNENMKSTIDRLLQGSDRR